MACLGGTRDGFGLYLGSDVARLSRGLMAVVVGAFCAVREGALRVDVGEGVELSVVGVGWVTLLLLVANTGDLRLLFSPVGGSFASFIVTSLVAVVTTGGLRRASFEFSLLPNTSAMAFETES